MTNNEIALDIPEIRNLVGQFLTVNDAISCARVCKAWSSDFVCLIWNFIDFDTHTSFEKLDSGVVSKNGSHIRVVNNLKSLSELNLLLQSSIKNIRDLTLSCSTTARFRSLCMEFIRNNNHNLRTLEINMDEDPKPKNQMISVDALVPYQDASKLTYLRLYQVYFSRGSFEFLLRGCPLLSHVELEMVLLPSALFVDNSFRHTGMVRLTASIDQVFMSDPDKRDSALGSSLLVSFPNLRSWLVYCDGGNLVVPVDRIKAEVKLCCPKLTRIDTWTTKRRIIYSFMADVFENLTEITFAYSELTEYVVVALLFHSATIMDITALRDDRERVERNDFLTEQDHFQMSGRTLQLLTRNCSKLEDFSFELHIMDMNHVEQAQWGCKGLKRLRTRIKDLDTTEKVERALQLWTEGRKIKDKRKDCEEEKEEKPRRMSDTGDSSIESRVARHLLAFESLEAVWLGTRTRYA